MLFEKQKYQEDCVANILTVFEDTQGLDDFTSFKESIKKLQTEKGIEILDRSDELRLDILMETGTGKTFTYLKTMYELNKQYAKNKFIIFVPRLAIRAGIIQNINLTADYFFQEYGKRIKHYHYADKSGLSQVEAYIRNEREFSVLILTSASINTNTKKKSHHTRILTRRNENLFRAESPLLAISNTKPIVFIDEPHLLKGEKFVEAYNHYFSSVPLLRFGATFAEENHSKISNVVYILDSLTAFNDCLVKKIAVSTIIDKNVSLKFYRSGDKKRPILLSYFQEGIEHEQTLGYNENITAFTGNAQHNFHVIRIKDEHVILSNGRKNKLSSVDYSLSDDNIREMIRATIRIHFEKEESLFMRGIKTLSLFFIPNIADYRDENPRIKKIFEEEYKKQRTRKLKKDLQPAYREYLEKDYDSDRVLRVNEGYFSGDGASKGSKGSIEEKENAGVNLILNEKEKLLSTKEPLRFIFSVWALQEGWDNPNIFNICKLAATNKEIKLRQQVGRGLRLAVDQYGKRQTIRHCGDDENLFYNINMLDVIVSGHEKNFIEKIQQEIIASSITSYLLTKKELMKLGLNEMQIDELIYTLRSHHIITPSNSMRDFPSDSSGDSINPTWKINSPIHEFLKNHKDKLPGHLGIDYDEIIKEFAKNRNKQNPVINRNIKKKTVKIKPSLFKEFDELWKIITQKAKIVYESINEEHLIEQIEQAFDREDIPPLRKKFLKQVYNHKNNTIETIEEKDLGVIDFFDTSSYEDFVKSFSKEEILPLSFCIKMFNKIGKEKIKINPKESSTRLKHILKNEIHASIIHGIHYELNSEVAIGTRSIFYEKSSGKNNKIIPRTDIEVAKLGKYISNEKAPDHYLYDKIPFDSKIEEEVIKDDSPTINEDEITVFAKLPRISIPTPYKTYSPDFAYLVKRKTGNRLFLIVETKGYDTDAEIPDDEQKKMKYAEKFFTALNEVTPNTQVVYKKRINKTRLGDLLREIADSS